MNRNFIISGGIINLLFVLFHISLWQFPGWPTSLDGFSNMNKSLLYVLNNHVALTAFFFFYISVFQWKNLLSTKIGRSITIFITIFYFIRALEELIFFNFNYQHISILIIVCIVLIGVGLLYFIPFIRSIKEKVN